MLCNWWRAWEFYVSNWRRKNFLKVEACVWFCLLLVDHVDSLMPYYLEHAKKVFPYLDCMDDLSKISDMSLPANWYPTARGIQRKVKPRWQNGYHTDLISTGPGFASWPWWPNGYHTHLISTGPVFDSWPLVVTILSS